VNGPNFVFGGNSYGSYVILGARNIAALAVTLGPTLHEKLWPRILDQTDKVVFISFTVNLWRDRSLALYHAGPVTLAL
jgi:hypothetical protein